MLILGSFDESGNAIVSIRVAGELGSRDYPAVIDTGFSGFVALPLLEMIPLGLVTQGAANVMLGDGSVVPNLVAAGSVTFGGQTESGTILLDETSTDVLVGMAFLREFNLALILTSTVVLLYHQHETLEAVVSLMRAAPMGAPNTAPSSIAFTPGEGAMSNQTLCINKSNRMDPHERITHMGGINDQGQRWRVTQEEAIQGIESGKWQFHVRVGLRDVRIVIAVSPYGNEYIKTEADQFQPSNLLNLPECPL
jgi:predicted aspartyl protease